MYINLNPLQQAAIDEEENALVLACPGSGKTRILTLKIANELEKLNKRTHRIAALTFTNRAADEIDKRINSMSIDVNQLWTGTIHSFCLQWIIRPYGIYLPELQRGYSILDELKAQDLKETFKSKFDIPRFNDFITRRDKNGDYINSEEKYNNAAKAYHKFILENKLIDFDLILYFSYNLIKKHPKISRNLSNIFKYFFIDEYQDTQDLQYAIVGKIIKAAEGKCKIFLVGDPDQAIFKSLGGIVKDPMEISEDIGGYSIKQLGLSNNYRSTQRLINLYSNFQSTGLVIESLADYCNEEGIVKFDENTHKDNLVDRIAEIIKKEISDGVSPNDICILAPQWSFLSAMARRLKANLPYIELDAPGLTPLPRDRDNFWFKLARIFLITKEPNKYLVRMKWAREILEELVTVSGIMIEVNNDTCRIFLKKINSTDTKEENAIEYLKESFKYLFEKLKFDYSSSELLKEQWDNFFNGLRQRYESPDFRDIPKDINYMKRMFNTKEGLVINTCQGVKGEEFHTVIAFGLLRGYLPHWNQIINQPITNEIEESNKLLYVICSRAKKNLYLFAENGRTTVKRRPYEVNKQLSTINFMNI
ncbi:UvrD-helicase domain-containing protein [Terribacillus sp. DMT04]|uniref:UvrD-helicase domain-containing protein n=1 Tax=Terribacillus sp. DMT04 TaxID=2850441 RepID=UPI001C2CBF59|nr:ATP-dependent helicase [Terribacillus sp. DMT04]QXE01952.1 ATP-dependent helicase [Terribacillus sp. DMT04]